MIPRFTAKEIDELVSILKEDKVISVPTDTVYGVCARIDSKNAENALRTVKNRPLTKAFPIMCSCVEQINEIAYVDDRALKVINTFMPGPITIVLKKKENIPDYINGGMETLAIRMAPNDTIKSIIEKLGSPLFMTSANQSGEKTCTSLDEIEVSCPLLSGMLIGNTEFKEASTIVDLSKEEIKILRNGPISLTQITNIIEEDNHD